ncbi:MAG: hypothetical protein KKE24_07335 [Candidatus Thermoplasmatota archaeon]|nr:hypothetical protein [Candidatus Thermoplasmatota archaeon]
MTTKIVVLGLACLLAVTAIATVGNVSASGDQVQHTHGEDEGYYDANNNNPFEDETFPGQSSQNRSGM